MSTRYDGWEVDGQFMLEYRDLETNSDKFYEITILVNQSQADYRVVYRWGRRHSTGQTSFKIAGNIDHARSLAQHRHNQKVGKGYAPVPGRTFNQEPTPWLLERAGVNLYTAAAVNVDEGVSFEEMGTLVAGLLTKAVNGSGDEETVDVMVEAATMNAKFAVLRAQFESVQSEVEFVNTAVRSRL